VINARDALMSGSVARHITSRWLAQQARHTAAGKTPLPAGSIAYQRQ